jgi:hypothetical protein
VASDLLFLTGLMALLLAWFLFCAAMNHRPGPRPTVTDPGREAIASLIMPQPMPTGRHRDPASPMPPFTYRPTAGGGC